MSKAGQASGEPELLVERDSSVVTLTLNRPAKLNALTDTLMGKITAAMRDIAERDDDHVVVLTGTGRGFCSGADISPDRISPIDPTRGLNVRAMLQDRWAWITELRKVEKPVICAINGVVAGAGLGLMLASDVRIASSTATFRTVFVERALVPDAGVSYLLPRLIGPGRALDLFWRAEAISADEALSYGLVEHVVPADELAARAREYALRLAAGPTVAIALTKRAVYRGLAAPSLDDHAAYEQSLWNWSHSAEDYHEGRRAFGEKRPPRYTSR